MQKRDATAQQVPYQGSSVESAATATAEECEQNVRKSILDAIQAGDWDFEPDELSSGRFDSTAALPGSDEKLEILAKRAEKGLPLWNEEDCIDYEQADQRKEESVS